MNFLIAFLGVFMAAIHGVGFRNDDIEVADPIKRMSLEEKVGQLFIAHFQGDIANEDAKTLICDVKVGGIIYYNWANGLTSPEQVKVLSESLQNLARQNRNYFPLLIATDQEGGRVSRLKSEGFTQFPSNLQVASKEDKEYARTVALQMSREMLSVGVNMNLAPVVDVNSNPKNPVIGDRSFGSDPETVIHFAGKALSGYKEAGMIATLKHFPGHGDVEVDSHEDLPMINKSLDELEKGELAPFATLSPLADVVMSAHLLVPALDEENCTTLSKKTLDYLRDKIGFKGVIISDSLVMQGVLKRCQSIDEAAIRALNAGHDILLLGGKVLNGSNKIELTSEDVKRVHASVVAAVRDGRVLESRVDAAVEKVIQLKRKLACCD